MTGKFIIYNTLSRKKEEFKPINPPHVGIYACGPTVYSDPHLGHARQAVIYDILYRYLEHIGYKVRYVRNITDVGHLEDEVSGEGEDRIARKARLEKLEPMEVAQHYTNRYHLFMDSINVRRPGIEPHASGHIIEQQQLIKKIIENGYAYEVNGSVYFDVEKYNQHKPYGILSGRKIEDLMSNTRQLQGQTEKRNSLDFALWKKASPSHMMHWPSEWSEGFPGWHLECSAMSNKYLGDAFDIHGGGMDLLFPHHECEIAQTTAAFGKSAVKYWVHNNMITINGQKMARSLNNFITLEELFSGNHEILDKAYSPMSVRFFILQAHYRSTLDFSNEALQASEKGFKKLMQAFKLLSRLKTNETSTVDVKELKERCETAIADDLNTPVLIAALFEGVKWINAINEGLEKISSSDLTILKDGIFIPFVLDVLGLVEETSGNSLTPKLIEFILTIRLEAKRNRDFETSDRIRDQLESFGIIVKDKKDGFDWELA
jgi:cysteinyl-tRNA synthetase